MSLGASALIVIAIIMIVGFGVFLTNSFNSTSTSSYSSTETTSQTTIASLPAGQNSSSTSPSGLRLDLMVAPSNGSLGSEVIEVDEYNTLDTVNNITLASNWLYPQSSLDPYAPCSLIGAVGLAIFQGNYGLNNYTQASALALYNTSKVFSCTSVTYRDAYYSFKPQSDQASLISSEIVIARNAPLSLSFTAKGYWTGGLGSGQTPAFHSFQGAYTLLAADEWGKVVLVHLTVTSAGLSYGTSTSTIGSYSTSQGTVTTNSAASWDYAQVANLTLNSPNVQSFIKDAYSYSVSIYSDHFAPNLITVLINVNGSQSVVGNYTTGYKITFSGIKVLNATVQFTPPNSYIMAAIGVTNIPNQTESASFSPQQQHVIQVALSNSTVQNLMGKFPYYVEYIDQFPSQNGTFAGDYFVFMFQVNGTRTVGIYVNPGINAVVDAYAGTRVSTICFGSSNPLTCFTSPWNSTG